MYINILIENILIIKYFMKYIIKFVPDLHSITHKRRWEKPKQKISFLRRPRNSCLLPGSHRLS